MHLHAHALYIFGWTRHGWREEGRKERMEKGERLLFSDPIHIIYIYIYISSLKRKQEDIQKNRLEKLKHSGRIGNRLQFED